MVETLIHALITVGATVIVLGVLIFVHELGHFMTAKAVDIEVPRFSIGFGPKVFGFVRGETEYVLSLLPLGGYVKMAGTEDMEVIEGAATINDTGTDIPATERKIGPRDFDAKSLPARALVISAGVIMNIIFAIVVYTFIGAVYGVPADAGNRIAGVTEELLDAGSIPLAGIRPGARVTAINDRAVSTRRDLQVAVLMERAGDARLHLEDGSVIPFKLPKADTSRLKLFAGLDPLVPTKPIIDRVVKDDVADRAGIKPGDVVLQAAGQPITDWSELTDALERSPGQPISLIVQRKGAQIPISLVPRDETVEGRHIGRIGVGGKEPPVPMQKASFGTAVSNGVSETWHTFKLTVDFLKGLFTGRQSPRSMGGPIMIGQMSGEMVRLGLASFLNFMALLSVNLAVLNLLPIPVLDGGHLVFLLIEGIRGGKPLSMQTRMRFTQVGFVMIVCIMVWALGNDLFRVLF